MNESQADSPAEIGTPTEVSLYAIGAAALQNRWLIVRLMLAGAVLSVLPIALTPPTYTAFGSFISQAGEDNTRPGFLQLAEQFGVLGKSSSQLSADYHMAVLESGVILGPMLTDSFTIAERDNQAFPLYELLKLEKASAGRMTEAGVKKLRTMIDLRISPKTGIVTVLVTSQWPSLSEELTNRLLKSLDEFNLGTRQSQASEERRFTEKRLTEARRALLAAEDSLLLFLQHNRQFQSSPQLVFNRERLQRSVSLRQQIVGSLSEALEGVRIREVRDTPLITIIEKPTLPVSPNSRGRVKRGLAGLIAGSFIGLFLAFGRDLWRRRSSAKDPEMVVFRESLAEAKGDLARLFSRREKVPK